MNLLLDDYPLVVLPKLATGVGLNAAIILQQLHWTSLHRDGLVRVDPDGRRWVQASLDYWTAEFPFWSEPTVKRTLAHLRELNIVHVRRAREGNLYALNYTAVEDHLDPIGGSQRSNRPDQNDPSLDKKETKEKTKEEEEASAATSAADDGQLFETPPTPSPAQDESDAAIATVWETYVEVFGDRLRVKELTPPRERTIRKALKAVADNVELCQRAIQGLKSYRHKHPQGSPDVSISVIFETGPHSKSNLTDQIQWWAEQAEGERGRDMVPRPGAILPLNLSGVPSVSLGRIQARRQEVVRMYTYPDSKDARQRGEAAVDWLKENTGHAPNVVDGELRGFKLADTE